MVNSPSNRDNIEHETLRSSNMPETNILLLVKIIRVYRSIDFTRFHESAFRCHSRFPMRREGNWNKELTL